MHLRSYLINCDSWKLSWTISTNKNAFLIVTWSGCARYILARNCFVKQFSWIKIAFWCQGYSIAGTLLRFKPWPFSVFRLLHENNKQIFEFRQYAIQPKNLRIGITHMWNMPMWRVVSKGALSCLFKHQLEHIWKFHHPKKYVYLCYENISSVLNKILWTVNPKFSKNDENLVIFFL